jgi:hypothetical protein
VSRERGERETAAHNYAEHGMHVFPCVPGEKVPAVAHGFEAATTDHGQIEKWWKANPGRNVAIRTGAPHGPDVLDVDVKESGTGFPALAKLRQAGLTGTPQAMIRTPSGGAHLVYRGTGQRNGHIEAAHVDFRAAGGYVVAPPSGTHQGRYVVVSHQVSGDAFDWAAARRLLEPERMARLERQGASSAAGGRADPDRLIRYVAECGDHVNDRTFWAACRLIEAGHQDRLPDLVKAAYRAGEDRRGQAERTVESAFHTVGAARPESQREAG